MRELASPALQRGEQAQFITFNQRRLSTGGDGQDRAVDDHQVAVFCRQAELGHDGLRGGIIADIQLALGATALWQVLADQTAGLDFYAQRSVPAYLIAIRRALGAGKIGFHHPRRVFHQALFPVAKFDPGLDQPADDTDMFGQTKRQGTDDDIILEGEA